MRAWFPPLSAVLLLCVVLGLESRTARGYSDRGGVGRAQADLDGALAVLDKLLELDPDNVELVGKRGDLRRKRGDLAGALSDFDKVVEAYPQYAGAYVNRGLVLSLQEQWRRAHDDFDAAWRAEAGDWYPAFYRCAALMRTGRAGEAKTELGEALAKRAGAPPDAWPAKVAEFLLGKIDEAALMKAAEDKDAETTRGHQCEAWYFAGIARLTSGQPAEAAACFRKSVATGLKHFTEYRLAQGELARLK